MAAKSSIARVARQISSSPVVRSQWRCPAVTKAGVVNARLFSTSKTLEEKKYTKDHEWIDVQGNTATLGITAFAAKALGDVVYVELPEVDAEFSGGDALGAVESVKSASDINTPISGTVTEVNSTLEEKPGNLNKDPEGEAWIAKLSLEEGALESSSSELLTAEEYNKFTEEVDGDH